MTYQKLIKGLQETLRQYRSALTQCQAIDDDWEMKGVLYDKNMEYGLCDYWRLSTSQDLYALYTYFCMFQWGSEDEPVVNLCTIVNEENTKRGLMENKLYLGNVKGYQDPIRSLKVRIKFLEVLINELKKHA